MMPYRNVQMIQFPVFGMTYVPEQRNRGVECSPVPKHDVGISQPAGGNKTMSRADTFNAKADEAERHAREFPQLRAQYLEVAQVWRSMARQTRTVEDVPLF